MFESNVILYGSKTILSLLGSFFWFESNVILYKQKFSVNRKMKNRQFFYRAVGFKMFIFRGIWLKTLSFWDFEDFQKLTKACLLHR